MFTHLQVKQPFPDCENKVRTFEGAPAVKTLELSYQEARRVVQQAAKPTAEVSLQEGGVFWRDSLRVKHHQTTADVCRPLVTCESR